MKKQNQVIMIVKTSLIEEEKNDHLLELILTTYCSSEKKGLTERVILDINNDVINTLVEYISFTQKQFAEDYRINYDPELLIEVINNQRIGIVDNIDNLIADEVVGAAIMITLIASYDAKEKGFFSKLWDYIGIKN